MATVNEQITDAVTQANVSVVGHAPSVALGSLYQTLSHATALSAQNAVANQQNLNNVSLAVTARCVRALVRDHAG